MGKNYYSIYVYIVVKMVKHVVDKNSMLYKKLSTLSHFLVHFNI